MPIRDHADARAMPRRLASALATWPFVLAVAVLLLNDGWWKAAAPGWLTGKLSDVAGLALVAIVASAAWPARPRSILAVLALAFLWWKSPLSESFLQMVNAWLPVRIGRTVDYSDLIALAVVPLGRHVAAVPQRYALGGPRLRRALLLPVGVAALLGVMGTSVLQIRNDYAVRSPPAALATRHAAVAEAIRLVAADHDLVCRDCTNLPDAGTYAGDGVFLSYAFQAPDTIGFTIEAHGTAIVFGRTGAQKASALREALNAALVRKFGGLELIEQLKPPYGR